MTVLRFLLLATAVSSVLAAACGGAGAPRKVVVSEPVCVSARFLRMEVGKSYELIVDNTSSNSPIRVLTLRMERFPLLVEDELPPNTIINTPRSTVVLQAPEGESRSLRVRPTFTGEYIARCGAIVGGSSIVEDLPFQFVD